MNQTILQIKEVHKTVYGLESNYLIQSPKYLFWKQLHVKVMRLFTHHEKFENQLHVHRINQEVTFHVKMQRLNHVTLKKYKSYSRCTKYIYKYHDSHYKNVFKHFSGFSRSKCVFSVDSESDRSDITIFSYFVVYELFPFQFFHTRSVNRNLLYPRLPRVVLTWKDMHMQCYM